MSVKVREHPWGIHWEIKNCPWKSLSLREVSVKYLWENQKLSVQVRECPWGVRGHVKNCPCKSASVRGHVKNCPWKSVYVREVSVGKSKIVRKSLWTTGRCLLGNQNLSRKFYEHPWGIHRQIKNCPGKSVDVCEVYVEKSYMLRKCSWASVRCPQNNKKSSVKVREFPRVVYEMIKNYPWKSENVCEMSIRKPKIVRERLWGESREIKKCPWMSVSALRCS